MVERGEPGRRVDRELCAEASGDIGTDAVEVVLQSGLHHEIGVSRKMLLQRIEKRRTLTTHWSRILIPEIRTMASLRFVRGRLYCPVYRLSFIVWHLFQQVAVPAPCPKLPCPRAYFCDPGMETLAVAGCIHPKDHLNVNPSRTMPFE